MQQYQPLSSMEMRQWLGIRNLDGSSLSCLCFLRKKVRESAEAWAPRDTGKGGGGAGGGIETEK